MPEHYDTVAALMGIDRSAETLPDLVDMTPGMIRDVRPHVVARAMLHDMAELDVVSVRVNNELTGETELYKQGECVGDAGQVVQLSARIVSDPTHVHPRLLLEQTEPPSAEAICILPLEEDDDLPVDDSSLRAAVAIGARASWISSVVFGRFGVCPPAGPDAAVFSDPVSYKER